MKTCRDVIGDALRAIGAMALGGEPHADELDAGLAAIGEIALDLHAARGGLWEVDVALDFLACENQRVRVEAGAQVEVTLPNSIVCSGLSASFDYASRTGWPVGPLAGSSDAADGVQSRPPHDGARIEIVGETQALYFYRADLNAWVVVSTLTLDGPTPLNSRYDGPLSALVAERLADPLGLSPSPVLAGRIARGNAALMLQSVVRRDQHRTAYL